MNVLALLDALATREERAWLRAWLTTWTIGAVSVLVVHGLYLVVVCR